MKYIYRNYLKRLFDIIFSSLLMMVLSPVIIVCIILIFIQNNGKVFFRHMRPGKDLIPFEVIKFKTMSDKKYFNGELLPDVERITSLGKLIRKLSLDELPQLINVIKGDMSLIGPRPLMMHYKSLYSPEQNIRHNVKPGITGWAQVNGRNSISWKKKFELDIYYVDNLTFALDCKIVYLTIIKILKQEGVDQSGLRPMQPFNGNN